MHAFKHWQLFIFANDHKEHAKPVAMSKNPKFTLKDLHTLVCDYLQVDPFLRCILDRLVALGQITQKEAENDLRK